MNSQKSINFFVFGTLWLTIFVCSSCAPIQQINIRAHVLDNSSGWRITHGSLHGQLETDLLTNQGMKIEVSNFRHGANFRLGGGEFFEILTEFEEVNSNIFFSPSQVTVMLSNGIKLKAKGIECSNIKSNFDLHDFQKTLPTDDKIKINNNACFRLFFNNPAPPLDEEIVMYMNEALKSVDNKIDVPPVYFRKTVKNIYRFGFFQ